MCSLHVSLQTWFSNQGFSADFTCFLFTGRNAFWWFQQCLQTVFLIYWKNVFVHLLVMKWEIKYLDSTERERLLTFLRILQKYLFYFFLFDSLVHILLVRFYWHLIGSHEFTLRTFVTWNHFGVIVVFMFSQITSTRKCWTA